MDHKQFDMPTSTYGHIQWNSSKVTVDLFCDCGCQYQVTTDDLYYFKCPHCGTVYALNPYIQLIKVKQDELPNVVKVKTVKEIKVNESTSTFIVDDLTMSDDNWT